MSPSTTQQWTRRIRYSDQHIRVSDADRSAVAELLTQHYAEGRLDQDEFDDRVGRTMAAKTRGDLAGLFDDLPETGPAGAGPAGPPGGNRPTGGPGRPRRGQRPDGRLPRAAQAQRDRPRAPAAAPGLHLRELRLARVHQPV